MQKNPSYELFEAICRELASRSPAIIPDEDLDSELVEDLKEYFDETSGSTAVERAIQEIKKHFDARGADSPFSFEKLTREFRIADEDFIRFVADAANRRGVGKNSVEFEKEITDRLCRRLTGAVHRVGSPRSKMKSKREYAKYLGKLGFDKNVLGKRDKDGGFDVLWLPPLGVTPLRPLISVQCKNSSYDEDDANESVGKATRTLRRHPYVSGQQIHFVVFNDYIDESYQDRARGLTFVPLGLSDLAACRNVFEKFIL